MPSTVSDSALPPPHARPAPLRVPVPVQTGGFSFPSPSPSISFPVLSAPPPPTTTLICCCEDTCRCILDTRSAADTGGILRWRYSVFVSFGSTPTPAAPATTLSIFAAPTTPAAQPTPFSFGGAIAFSLRSARRRHPLPLQTRSHKRRRSRRATAEAAATAVFVWCNSNGQNRSWRTGLSFDMRRF
ncbi:hypothetical protein MSAN_01628100 [Mycena sanguinolenta]|uniref:Uncharacterized protein n=1 Tax=Mycena sanguinolenta TaxID=230812 RepID=A0A8H6Y2C5_9AGAR|nr:hypothetical protein MSAN_01628100 [Mycena sanguinolenta]